MITELYGSPGAGKTYAINQIHPGTIKEGSQNRLKRFIKSLVIMSPFAYRVRRVIRECVRGIYIDSFRYNPVEIDYYIKNISMLAAVYRYRPIDTYMDEGIVHRVISMCINYGITMEVCESIISRLRFALKDVRVVYLYASVEDCRESILKRNRHLHGIDELTGDTLNRFLEDYDEYCQSVCVHFGHEKLDRNEIIRMRTDYK